MRPQLRPIWLGLIFALMFAIAPTTALAAEPRQGGNITIGPDETINDDLYLFGGTITVQGRVNGDLVVFGGTINVSGPVTGDVISAGGTTTLTGPIGGSVRAGGGTTTIGSTVEQDVVVGGGNVVIEQSANIGRDVLIGAGTTTINGTVERNVSTAAGTMAVNGRVGGDVRFDGSSLQIGQGAAIGGNLVYRSENEANIAQGATIDGTIDREVRPAGTPAQPLEVAIATIIGWLRALVGAFALGLLFVLLFPRFSRQTGSTLSSSPWASLGLGLVALIAVPIVAIIVLVVGILIGGWWLALIVLSLYGIALALSFVVAGLFVGRWILDRVARTGFHLIWGLLLGLAILLLVSLVPIVGGIVLAVAVLFGFGALLLTVYREHQAPATAAV